MNFNSYHQVSNPKAPDLTRTDVENYDIEELYEFADATGILERHKALLSQPFNESQVCEVSNSSSVSPLS